MGLEHDAWYWDAVRLANEYALQVEHYVLGELDTSDPLDNAWLALTRKLRERVKVAE